MSKKLASEKHFISLLLNTDKVQAKALLNSITFRQIQVLIEIFANLQRLKVPAKTGALLRKRKRVINKLLDKNLTLRNKLLTVQQHTKQIYDTLLSVKTQLLTLLK